MGQSEKPCTNTQPKHMKGCWKKIQGKEKIKYEGKQVTCRKRKKPKESEAWWIMKTRGKKWGQKDTQTHCRKYSTVNA